MAEGASTQFDDRAISRLAGLDKQIEVLFTCKPLPESEISKLCDMVSPLPSLFRHHLH